MSNKKGFTLIELLVVIAIIGLLSSLAIVSLSGARNKAYDAQIKSDLSQFRNYVELNYPEGDYTALADADFATAGLTAPSCGSAAYTRTLSADNFSWAASSPLCADSANFFCVDSSGAARVTAAASALGVCPAGI